MNKRLSLFGALVFVAVVMSSCSGPFSAQQSRSGTSKPLGTPSPRVRAVIRLESTTPIPLICPVTLVYSGGTDQFGLAEIPHVQAIPASSQITAYLFFANPGASKSQKYRPLHTGGGYPDGTSTKILWTITHPQATDTITIMGKKLFAANQTFQQSFPEAASPAGNYPSIVNVPTPGCWQLTLKSGPVTAHVVFWVVSS